MLFILSSIWYQLFLLNKDTQVLPHPPVLGGPLLCCPSPTHFKLTRTSVSPALSQQPKIPCTTLVFPCYPTILVVPSVPFYLSAFMSKPLRRAALSPGTPILFTNQTKSFWKTVEKSLKVKILQCSTYNNFSVALGLGNKTK